MLLSILFFIFQVLLGFSLFSFWDSKQRFLLAERIAGSIILGLLLSNFCILIFALIFSSLPMGIVSYVVVAAIVLIMRSRETISLQLTAFFSKAQEQVSSMYIRQPWVWGLIAILFIYAIFVSLMFSTKEDGSLRTSFLTWSDTAFHVDLVQYFTNISPFTLEHPMFAGARLPYHFLIDFMSAVFHRLGADIVLSFHLPLIALGVAAILLLFSFAWHVLKSRGFAFVALLLILLGSGFGFHVFFNDLQMAYQEDGISGIAQTIRDPPHDYTHLDNRTGGRIEERETENNIVWIVPVVSFLWHQRSFTLGFSVVVLLLLGLYYYGNEKEFWRFGFLAGLLPLSHAHSFLAVAFLMASLFWFFLRYWKSWMKFALVAAIVSVPQILYFRVGDALASIGKPWFGWMTCVHTHSWFFCDSLPGTDSNALVFWVKNFGVVFLVWILVVLAFFVILFIPRVRSTFMAHFDPKFIIASLVLFLLPNLFLFDRWVFNNGKILFYWWIIAILFVVIPVFKMLWKWEVWGRGLVIVLVILGSLAGSIDFFLNFFYQPQVYFSDSDAGVEFAQWIEERTPPDALFLAAPSPDPIPLFVGGRPVYLGFGAWVWVQGLDYFGHKKIAQEILAGDVDKACQENIKFIVLDSELEEFFPSINREVLLSRTEVVFDQEAPSGERKVLQISCDGEELQTDAS